MWCSGFRSRIEGLRFKSLGFHLVWGIKGKGLGVGLGV